ncbi:TPA: hypothetical protein DDW35_06785 [Candidatus Sumerlaeota bacterium]|nr:hypothetical protein [Candidatus Sumerlaeota bacterium]
MLIEGQTKLPPLYPQISQMTQINYNNNFLTTDGYRSNLLNHVTIAVFCICGLFFGVNLRHLRNLRIGGLFF